MLQVINLLTQRELSVVLSNKLLQPRTFTVKPTQTMFVSGLGRIDYVEVNDNYHRVPSPLRGFATTALLLLHSFPLFWCGVSYYMPPFKAVLHFPPPPTVLSRFPTSRS